MDNPSITVHVINNTDFLVEHIPSHFGLSAIENKNLEVLVVIDFAFDSYSIAKDKFFSSEL
ncbi:hypothetical protein D3C87_1615580 [compost metagenome]